MVRTPTTAASLTAGLAVGTWTGCDRLHRDRDGDGLGTVSGGVGTGIGPARPPAGSNGVARSHRSNRRCTRVGRRHTDDPGGQGTRPEDGVLPRPVRRRLGRRGPQRLRHRNDVLRRDLTDVRTTSGTGGCGGATGTLAGPYNGTTIAFVRGVTTSSTVQIDHVVALSDAWQTGALTWTADQRDALANDPLNLLAVQGRLNEQKGDGDAATWLPPNKEARCAHVARQVAVKSRCSLWVTPPEKAAIARVPSPCPRQRLPSGGQSAAPEKAPLTSPAPTTDGNESTAPRPATPPRPTPTSTVDHSSCGAVRNAGRAPLAKGQPGYRAQLDGDHDGAACQ